MLSPHYTELVWPLYLSQFLRWCYNNKLDPPDETTIPLPLATHWLTVLNAVVWVEQRIPQIQGFLKYINDHCASNWEQKWTSFPQAVTALGDDHHCGSCS
ncbi:hypothetical protein Pelo_2086 [Pelomyxa schiedti]|nr:hypothetical protein Pelo_2086 [Pelomyxa schiedti]